MKRLLLLAIPILLLAALASSTLTAQDQPTRIVFIDSQRAINAHPAGAATLDLQRQARDEVQALQGEIQQLVNRASSGQQLTTQDQERYRDLVATLEAVQARWQQDIAQAVQPALEAVNSAVAQVAQANGYTLVLDGAVAGDGGLGLVVYAQSGLDITDQVIEQIR